jgi:AcrR family transcriptional regulator
MMPPENNTPFTLKSSMERSIKKDKIVSAAAGLLAVSCLHSISIRDIAKAARVNSALISYYFGGKDQLYEAVIQQQFERFHQEVACQYTSDGDILENFRRACKALVAFNTSNPYMLVLYFRELANPSSAYSKFILPCISDASSRFTSMIQAGIDQGIFKSDTNPQHVVMSLVGMINYCFMTCNFKTTLGIVPAENVASYVSFSSEMLLQQICVIYAKPALAPADFA